MDMMAKGSPTNLRWAVCCQTCCHFHEAPVATGEGECKAVNPPFEVLAGNVCDLHKPSNDTQPTDPGRPLPPHGSGPKPNEE